MNLFRLMAAILLYSILGMPEIQAQESQQAQDPQLQAVRRAAGGETPTLTLAGKKISIRYHPQATNQGAQRIVELQEGTILALTESAALRLRTEADLIFGNTIIKTENQAPNYPGVYSVWLKKVKDGWRLVFNSQADIWGTQHEGAHDIAEVLLQEKKIEAPASRLSIQLLPETETGGLLKLAWGPHEWTARFSVAIRPIAAK